MVTMLERERIILTVLYVIPSGPAYVHYDCSMVWKETSDGEKKKTWNPGMVPTEFHV